MRKFLATIALCITLIGVFAPVVFSVSVARENNQSQKIISVGVQKVYAEEPASVKLDDSSVTDCGKLDFVCGSFKLFLTFVYFIPNSILTLTAVITDASIHYSISSASFRDISSTDSLVYKGWSIARDFSNLGFIFALFIIAFSLILNRSLMNFNPKKAIVKVIVMALLINFSMLFCKLIIQTGDLFANILYTRIDAPDPSKNISTDNAFETLTGGPAAMMESLGVRGITLGVISNINPQKLMQSAGGNYDIGILSFVGLSVKGPTFYVNMGFLALVTFFVNSYLIYIFVTMAMLFQTRIFGLWMLIIVSPIAFVSYAIPSLEDNPYFGFKNWLDELVKLSFAAPIFMFFVYLVISFLGQQTFGVMSNTGVTSSLMGAISIIMVKLSATVFILLKGKKIAFEMAGRAGKLTQKIVDKTAGAILNAGLAAATGGAAVVGRQVIGRAGVALAESGAVKGMMQGNSFAGKFLGKQVSKAGKKVGAASFDIRDSEKFKGRLDSFNKSMGEKINMGDRFQRKGGFEAEGGIRDITNTVRGKFEGYKTAQDKEIAELLKTGKGSVEQRNLRAMEAELARAQQAAAAEESRIEKEARESDPSAFIAKKQAEKATAQQAKQQLENDKNIALTAKSTAETAKNTAVGEKAALESRATALETQETTLKGEKRQLEQQRNTTTDVTLKAALDDKVKTKQSEIDDVKDEKEKVGKQIKEKDTEIKTKEGEIKAKEGLIKSKDEAIKKKDEEIQKANTYATILPNIGNVREAQQKKRDLEAREVDSIEKKEMTDAEEKMNKEDEKRKKLESDIEALGKKKANLTGAQLAQAELEISQKNAELVVQQAEYDAKKTVHSTKKGTYDQLFGNELTALRDFEADAVKVYKDQATVKQRIADGKSSVLNAQLEVNKLQDVIANTDYARISDFSNNVEANTSVFGAMGDHAQTRSADSMRREHLNNK